MTMITLSSPATSGFHQTKPPWRHCIRSGGIEMITLAISQMDAATQKNADLVEEQSSATSSLKSLAEQLAQVVSEFKLDQSSEPADARSGNLQLLARQ
jgi:hypothetical protein